MIKFLQLLSFLNLLVFALLMSKVDIKEKRLPNSLMYPAIILAYFILLFKGLAIKDLSIFTWDLIPILLLVIGFFTVSLIFPTGFGMGDVKGIPFLGISISHMGLQTLIFSLLLSFITASIYVLIVKISKGTDFRDFAFGPFLFFPAVFFLAINTF